MMDRQKQRTPSTHSHLILSSHTQNRKMLRVEDGDKDEGR